MRFYVGPYREWWGGYQIADLLKHIGVSEDTCHKLGEKLSKTFIHRICEWIDSKKKRKVKVKLHSYDTWDIDSTLSYIVIPLLKQFKEQDGGYGMVDDEDVPEEIRSYNAPPKENEWDMDSFAEDRWNHVLDEMIWAWSQEHPDCDWESQYHTGKFDITFKDTVIDGEEVSEMVTGPNDTHVFDSEGYKKHSDRIQKGLILFGKYLTSLWN